MTAVANAVFKKTTVYTYNIIYTVMITTTVLEITTPVMCRICTEY